MENGVIQGSSCILGIWTDHKFTIPAPQIDAITVKSELLEGFPQYQKDFGDPRSIDV